MNTALFLALLLTSGNRTSSCTFEKLPPAAELRAVGIFTNMRYTTEHGYGYSVSLWRAGDCVLGLLEASDGLACDTPAGQLEDVRYDPRNGALSFTACLTIGLFSDRTRTLVPSHDVFVFTGTLIKNTVSGSLSHSNALTPEIRPLVSHVKLGKALSETMPTGATVGEWRETIAKLLRFRGPRW